MRWFSPWCRNPLRRSLRFRAQPGPSAVRVTNCASPLVGIPETFESCSSPNAAAGLRLCVLLSAERGWPAYCSGANEAGHHRDGLPTDPLSCAQPSTPDRNLPWGAMAT